MGPKECLIPQGETAELMVLQKVLERNDVLVNKHKTSDFNHENAEQDLNR